MAALSIRAGVELTVKPAAMSITKQTRLQNVVCLELDGTVQSSSDSISVACSKTLKDVNRNSKATPCPKNSVKNYMSDKSGVLRFIDRLYARRALALVPGIWASLAQCAPGKDHRRNRSRKKPAPSPLQRALKQELSTFSSQQLSLTPPGNSTAERREP